MANIEMKDASGRTRHPSNINQHEQLAKRLEKRDRNYESESSVSKVDKIRILSLIRKRIDAETRGIPPEYHDYCALVVDRHDVKKVMVGLMAGRGWGTLACKPASLEAWRDTSSFLVNLTNQVARRTKGNLSAAVAGLRAIDKGALDANAKACSCDERGNGWRSKPNAPQSPRRLGNHTPYSEN